MAFVGVFDWDVSFCSLGSTATYGMEHEDI